MTEWRRIAGLNPVRVFNYALGLGFAALIAVAVIHAMPPRHVTIETGPVGGSFYHAAEKYQRALTARGFRVSLHPDPNSLDIIDRVNAAPHRVRIGFVAQRLDPQRFPAIRSLGAIEMQPVFVFYANRLGGLRGLDGLRGKRLVMPPARSGSADAARLLLGEYDVTPANTSFTYLPIAEAVAALRAGRYDAGFFMLTPRNQFVTRLAATPGLSLLDLHDTLTLSRLEPYLTPVVLPHGVYGIERRNPPENVHLLAATVDVVARADTPAAVLYPLLEAMADAHRGATLINRPGTFPNLVDSVLPAAPAATQYEKSGMPWIYRTLPLWLASLIDSYFVIGIVVIVVVEFARYFLYVVEVVDFLFAALFLGLLGRIERRARRGGRLGRGHLMAVDLAERTLLRGDRHRRGAELIGRIRRHAGSAEAG